MDVVNRAPRQRIFGALALSLAVAAPDESMASLTRVLRTLTDVECHVLARAAVHCWTHLGRIPYKPPTLHQQMVAHRLAAPGIRLLEAVASRDCHTAYRLSPRGEAGVRRVFHVVPMAQLISEECTFARMSHLMRNDWESFAWEAYT